MFFNEQTNSWYTKSVFHIWDNWIIKKGIVDDILYQNIKNLTKPFHFFLTSGAETRKTFTLMCIIQKMLQYYIKQITNVLNQKLWN